MLISGAIGFGIHILQNRDDIQYIDNKSWLKFQELDREQMFATGLHLTYEGEDINTFTSLNVNLYNYTNKNIENIEVFIEIIPQKGDSIRIVEEEYADIDNQLKGIEAVYANEVDTLLGKAQTFGYKIFSANMADSIDKPFFKSVFTILSKKKPEYRITIKKAGYALTPYLYNHFDKTPFYRSDMAYLTYYILFIIVMIYFIHTITEAANDNWYSKLRKYRKILLQEAIDKKTINIEAEDILTFIEKTSDRFDYENASTFKKWRKNMKDPDKQAEKNEK